MLEHLFEGARIVVALGSALMAGTFFTFSIVIMRVLRQVPPATALMVMQTINTVIVKSIFLPVFLCTAGLSLILTGTTWWHETAHHTMLHVHAGTLCYVAGVFGLTVVVHVPRNTRLAALRADDPALSQEWLHYAKVWTRYNHVRTIAAVLATLFFIIG